MIVFYISQEIGMSEYTVEEVASKIDHAVLKPDQTEQDVRENAIMCIERGVASMCVRPCDIKLTADLLKDSSVMTSCVLSFPHGADTTEVKVFQAKRAIEDGTQEIDMVMNIGQFLSGNYDAVREDIKAVVDVAHAAGIAVKVIQESGFLTLEQIVIACELSCEAGADFVKTSTGFNTTSATPEIVDVMIKTVGTRMKVKPSGGIRNWETAVAYLEQGADRLGIGSTVAVLDGGEVEGDY